jgi:hypothetical protein
MLQLEATAKHRSWMSYRNGYLDVSAIRSRVRSSNQPNNEGQTYEGGISGAPNTEAHGAYAFCALACMSIISDPRESFAR